MDAIEKTLVDIEKAMVKLFNEGRVDIILKFFSNDFVGFSSTKHERLNKLAQLKHTFHYYLKEGDKVHFSVNSVKVKIYGETALTTFFWKVDITKNKKSQSIEGRGSHVFLLIDNYWKIVHEHFSKAH